MTSVDPSASRQRHSETRAAKRPSVGPASLARQHARRLNVLLVEDSPADAELIRRALRQLALNLHLHRVEDEVGMRAALEKEEWNVILSDYSLPRFSGLDALSVTLASGLDIPFVMVSGVVGEDAAVAAMRAGARDFLSKSNLSRLPAILERELEEAAARRARDEVMARSAAAERRWTAALQAVSDGICICEKGRIVSTNPAAARMLADVAMTLIGGQMQEVLTRLAGDQAVRLLAGGDHQVETRYGERWIRIAWDRVPDEQPDETVVYTIADVSALRILEARVHELLNRVTTAQETERTRIASEIHDDTIQVLAAISFRMERLRGSLGDERLEAMLADVEETVQLATRRLAELVFNLRPPELDFTDGLPGALRQYLDSTAANAGLAFQVRVREIPFSSDELEFRKRYLEFGDHDVANLQKLHPLAIEYAQPIIDRFYQHLLSFADTARRFTDARLLERVKGAQLRYFERLTGGVYDSEYAAERLHIGAVHERIGLDVKYYLGSYAFYLREVATRLMSELEPRTAMAIYQSLLKLVFLDMSLAIDTYIFHRERAVARADELEAANRELQAFSYSVSHDLRAPIRAVLGFSQALKEDCGDGLNEDARSDLGFIMQGAERAEQLIEDMIRLSKVAWQDMDRRWVCLSSLARDAAASLVATTDRQVDFRIAPEIWANADPGLLRVVFDNLLGNSLKFTSKHPTALIEVGTVEHDGNRAVFVRDDGAGFDPAYADKLFTAFRRLHDHSEFEGSGIGLATVRRIVERHGGRIWAEGQPERGATFTFSLPALLLSPPNV